MKRLLLTGAAGNIGRELRPLLARLAETVRVSDLGDLGAAAAHEELVPCDLADFEAVKALVQGCDGIVHLGGMSVESTFQVILDANIRGTYHLYEAARLAGVPRILFASSNHVIGFHDRNTRLDARAAPRPDSLYGVSKGYGELLSRYYHDKFGIQSCCVRIGSLFEEPRNRRMLATWLSLDDFVLLVTRVFDIDRLGWCLVYGASDNAESWWDNGSAGYLGWQPQDSADRFRDREPLQKPDTSGESLDPIAAALQGGPFASAGHFEDA